MALPSVFGRAGANPLGTQGRIPGGFCHALTIAPGAAACHNVFGPRWPIFIMPSLAWLPNKAKEGFVMANVATHLTGHKSEFDIVAEPFVQDQGLPFTDVLDAESIQRVFKEEDALFAPDYIFSTG